MCQNTVFQIIGFVEALLEIEPGVSVSLKSSIEVAGLLEKCCGYV